MKFVIELDDGGVVAEPDPSGYTVWIKVTDISGPRTARQVLNASEALALAHFLEHWAREQGKR